APTQQLTINGATASVGWASVPGKKYTVQTNDSLTAAGWQPAATLNGTGAAMMLAFPVSELPQFFRLQVQDLDSDTDGLTDSEEFAIGFDPATAHTQRYDQTDFQRVSTSWNSPSTITVGVLDADMSERWPTKGVIAIRRSGGLKPVTVN